MEKWITTGEAARILTEGLGHTVSVRRVRQLIELHDLGRPGLKGRRFGRDWQVALSSVRDRIATQRKEPVSP
jgi:hypothetical protein